MRNLKIVAAGLAVVTAALIAAPASATPAGLGAYPSTDIYGRGNFHFDVDNFPGTSLRDGGATSIGLSHGFGPGTDGTFGRSEAGFDYVLTGDNVSIGNRLLFHAKTQIFNNDDTATRVVAGLWGAGTASAGAPNYLYILGSREFGFGRIHAGLAFAARLDAIRVEDSFGFTNNPSRTSLHLAFDRSLTDNLDFAIDYYSGQGALSGVQPTFYYAINENAAFGLGYFRANNRNVGDNLYLSFDYGFGPTSGDAGPVEPGAVSAG